MEANITICQFKMRKPKEKKSCLFYDFLLEVQLYFHSLTYF